MFRIKSSKFIIRKSSILFFNLGLAFGLFFMSPAHAEDISVTVDPTNPFNDFPVVSSGGSYQVNVAANGGDPVVQLYSGTSAGSFNSAYASNPTNHVNENDDYQSLSSQISGSVSSGAYVVRVTSFAYWVSGSSPTQTYTLSYTGFTAPAPVVAAISNPEPILVPYLLAASSPSIHFKDDKLTCAAGTYQAGIAEIGHVPTHGKNIYKPSNFRFDLLMNGQAQSSLSIETAEPLASWNLSELTSTGIATCSVAISWNSLINEVSSMVSTDGINSAKLRQSDELITADKEYSALLAENSKTYQKAVIDNRVLWRTQIEAIRSNYYESIGQITLSNGTTKAFTSKLTTLKSLITAQRQSAADYRASQSAVLAAMDLANKVALDTKNAAITKANATHGAFIESTGYGVLIP